MRASYANFIWGVPAEIESVYPSLGVSLAGALGSAPTQVIQVSDDSVAQRAGIQVGMCCCISTMASWTRASRCASRSRAMTGATAPCCGSSVTERGPDAGFTFSPRAG